MLGGGCHGAISGSIFFSFARFNVGCCWWQVMLCDYFACGYFVLKVYLSLSIAGDMSAWPVPHLMLPALPSFFTHVLSDGFPVFTRFIFLYLLFNCSFYGSPSARSYTIIAASSCLVVMSPTQLSVLIPLVSSRHPFSYGSSPFLVLLDNVVVYLVYC